jgi:hypothetical protein
MRTNPWLWAGRTGLLRPVNEAAKATTLFQGLIQSFRAFQINPWEYLDDSFAA